MVRGLRVWLGNDAFFQFFEPAWQGKPLPEIVSGRAATCLVRYARPRHCLKTSIRSIPQFARSSIRSIPRDVQGSVCPKLPPQDAALAFDNLINANVPSLTSKRDCAFIPALPRAVWTRVGQMTAASASRKTSKRCGRALLRHAPPSVTCTRKSLCNLSLCILSAYPRSGRYCCSSSFTCPSSSAGDWGA